MKMHSSAGLQNIDTTSIADKRGNQKVYSRVRISLDTAFLKILKKPSVVQE